MSKHPRLLHIMTVPVSLGFLRGQPRYMKAHGFVSSVITSPGEQLQVFCEREGIAGYAVEMPRRITPLQDMTSIVRLWRQVRNIQPAIVHAHTPKGGLLGMIASWVAGVPIRIYHIHGLPFMTAVGWKRKLLICTERISATLATQVLCVSHSIREVAVAEGICASSKIKVLLGGTSNGVDALARFNPEVVGPTAREEIRRSLGIPADALVVGFVGRLVRDKGIVELAGAWKQLREQFDNLHLLAVGPFEPQDPVPPHVVDFLKSDPRVHLTGPVNDTAAMYAAMDVLALPTYREGFPNVPLEAAAMRLPVVATQIPGCTDAVEDGVTGTLVPPHDKLALARAVQTYLELPALRFRAGEAGRTRVLREFDQERIWAALHQEYVRLLKGCGLE